MSQKTFIRAPTTTEQLVRLMGLGEQSLCWSYKLALSPLKIFGFFFLHCFVWKGTSALCPNTKHRICLSLLDTDPWGVLFLSLAIKRQNPLPSQALVLTQFIITSCVSITSFCFYFSFRIDTLTEKQDEPSALFYCFLCYLGGLHPVAYKSFTINSQVVF